MMVAGMAEQTSLQASVSPSDPTSPTAVTQQRAGDAGGGRVVDICAA